MTFAIAAAYNNSLIRSMSRVPTAYPVKDNSVIDYATVGYTINEQRNRTSYKVLQENSIGSSTTTYVLIIVLSVLVFGSLLYVICGPIIRSEAYQMVQNLNATGDEESQT
ncbi:hypothetical protein GJ496_005559 [Pomphorhynchus laevis]|nr:hypothetical protein GJ496_005559 [Pomphorhynchus laevis]